MDLVTQGDALEVSELKDRIINSDMKGRAFNEGWSGLPFLFRAQLLLLVPIYVIYLMLFGTRNTLAESIALEDLPSENEDLFQDDRFTSLRIERRRVRLDDRWLRRVRNRGDGLGEIVVLQGQRDNEIAVDD